MRSIFLFTAGYEAYQIQPPFYKQKRGKIAIEPQDLENSVKSTFSAIYDSKKRKKYFKSRSERGKLFIMTSTFFE